MDVETPNQKTSREDTGSQTIIEPLQLYDPLLVLLKVKLRLNNWWVIMAMGVLSATGLFSWYLMGKLNPFQVLIGSVVVPLAMEIYLFLPSAITDLFKRLQENGVVGDCRLDKHESMTYQEFVEKQAGLIHSWWWIGMALFFVILFWITDFFFVRDSPITQAPLWLHFIMIFVFSVTGYTGFLGTVWLLIIGVVINRLFRIFTIRVKPLHPDGSGGLDLLNRFLWISITLVTVGACQAFATPPGPDRVIFLGAIVGYLTVVPLLLISWLVLPHQVMVQARNELLQPLTDEYERAISETMASVKGDTAAINKGTERLTALQKRYEQVRNSFPTWPIEIVQLHRLVIVLILPLLLALLPLLVDTFLKK